MPRNSSDAPRRRRSSSELGARGRRGGNRRAGGSQTISPGSWPARPGSYRTPSLPVCESPSLANRGVVFSQSQSWKAGTPVTPDDLFTYAALLRLHTFSFRTGPDKATRPGATEKHSRCNRSTAISISTALGDSDRPSINIKSGILLKFEWRMRPSANKRLISKIKLKSSNLCGAH